jgi:hypothetical protein
VTNADFDILGTCRKRDIAGENRSFSIFRPGFQLAVSTDTKVLERAREASDKVSFERRRRKVLRDQDMAETMSVMINDDGSLTLVVHCSIQRSRANPCGW